MDEYTQLRDNQILIGWESTCTNLSLHLYSSNSGPIIWIEKPEGFQLHLHQSFLTESISLKKTWL